MGHALFEPLPAADTRHDMQHEIVGRDAEVVHHAVIGCLEPRFVDQLTLGRDFVEADIVGAETGRGVADGDHVAAVAGSTLGWAVKVWPVILPPNFS